MDSYEYAKKLATKLHQIHFPDVKDWEPLPDLRGVLTQIDNMTASLIRNWREEPGHSSLMAKTRAGMCVGGPLHGQFFSVSREFLFLHHVEHDDSGFSMSVSDEETPVLHENRVQLYKWMNLGEKLEGAWVHESMHTDKEVIEFLMLRKMKK